MTSELIWYWSLTAAFFIWLIPLIPRMRAVWRWFGNDSDLKQPVHGDVDLASSQSFGPFFIWMAFLLMILGFSLVSLSMAFGLLAIGHIVMMLWELSIHLDDAEHPRETKLGWTRRYAPPSINSSLGSMIWIYRRTHRRRASALR